MLHEEDLTVYQDGTFVPVLGPQHFELLVGQPAHFAVKHFALTGLRRELGHEPSMADLAATAPETIDAAGDLVVPGFVNLHLHADKALLG